MQFITSIKLKETKENNLKNYYSKKIFIGRQNPKGETLGKVEKWEAHKKGVLHRGFSAILRYKNYYILQHRKHPLFDGFYDLTTSSHQEFDGKNYQSDEDAVVSAIIREWELNKDDLSKIKSLGKVYYKAKDENSEFMEHENCDVFEVEVNKIPTPNFDYAYGLSLVTKEELKKDSIFKNLCPWSKKVVKKLAL